MNFATDRDLLILEPNLFRDLPFVSQQRFTSTDAELTNASLSSASANFTSLGVTTGDVVLVNDQPLEVLARNHATTLSVSMIRNRITDAAIVPADVSEATLVVRTFGPQITLVHDMLMAMLSIDRDDPDALLGEDAITSTQTMTQLETLATLERIFSAAQALTGDNETVTAKARHYHHAFRQVRVAAYVQIDSDGDGTADTIQQPGIGKLTRS